MGGPVGDMTAAEIAVKNERRVDKMGRVKCRNCGEPPMPGKASCEYHLLLDQESGVKRRREVSDFLRRHGYGTPD